jgi:predicted nucleic acid-binding protein
VLFRSTAIEAEVEIQRLKTIFHLCLDTEAVYSEWERLVITHSVIGINVHDARLVAAMLVHGITHILTFNTKDFARYSEIIAVNPTKMNESENSIF